MCPTSETAPAAFGSRRLPHPKFCRSNDRRAQILPWHRRSSYEPDAPAREVPQSPRWRIGLLCARMRNFLAGVITCPSGEPHLPSGAEARQDRAGSSIPGGPTWLSCPAIYWSAFLDGFFCADDNVEYGSMPDVANSLEPDRTLGATQKQNGATHLMKSRRRAEWVKSRMGPPIQPSNLPLGPMINVHRLSRY